MANNEEKFKTFFKDEKKVEALMNDDEFIQKVSGGDASAETYKRKLETLGVTLTQEEAEKIKKATEALLEVPIDELNEETLKQISGGNDLVNIPMVAGTAVTVASGIASYGCLIAHSIYKKEFQDALKEGDIKAIRKYYKLSNKMKGAAVGLFGAELAGAALTTYGGFKALDKIYDGKLSGEIRSAFKN